MDGEQFSKMVEELVESDTYDDDYYEASNRTVGVFVDIGNL